MNFITFLQEIDDEKISVRHFQNPSKSLIFIMHWAGESSQERCIKIAEFFQKNHKNVVTFDYSGHGKSTNNSPSSISKKTKQAMEVLKIFSKNFDEIHIFAFSMSGQIAINLLEKYKNIASVSFFSPALYAEDFFVIPFWENFKKFLQEKWNWHRSNISRILPCFEGKIFLFRPEYDTVIPEEIFEMYKEFSPKNNFSKYIFKNAPHTLAKWLYENPWKIREISEKIFEK